MIRPLRKRHLVMQGSLALVVLIGMVQGIRLRQPMPISTAVPFMPFEELDGQEVPNLPVEVQLISGNMLLVHQKAPIQKPDVLLYLASTLPSNTALPENVFLLGAVGETNRAAFLIPETAQSHALHLIFYSLGHQEVIGTVLLENHS